MTNYKRTAYRFSDFAHRSNHCSGLEKKPAAGYSGLRRSWFLPGGHGIADLYSPATPRPQAIHLVGIESPGLTAAPSIATHLLLIVV